MIYKIKTKDNKVYYIKGKDAVSLKKGDWFINQTTNSKYDRPTIYKVVDDKFQKRSGLSETIIAEEYIVDYDTHGSVKLQKRGAHMFKKEDLKYIRTVFNSADEAIKWLKTQLALRKNDSKFKDARYQFPELTREDLDKASKYGLRLVKKLPDGDVILEGSMQQLKKYADDWLDYQLIKEYFVR